MKRFMLSLLAGATLMGVLISPAAHADASIPVADFYKRPQYGGLPLLSPDGKQMAVLTPAEGRMVLAVIDLETRKPRLVGAYAGWNVVNPRWINNHRLSFSVAKGAEVAAEDETGGGLFAVDVDGSNFSKLDITRQEARETNKPRKRLNILGNWGGDSNDLIVEGSERGSDAKLVSTDVFRLDTMTGRMTLMTFDNPGNVARWVIDHQHRVRGATTWTVEAGTKRIVQTNYYRDDDKAPWKKLYTGYWTDGSDMDLLGFDYDDKTLLVASRFGGRDKKAVFIWDFTKNAPGEMIADHPLVDIGAWFGDSTDGTLWFDHQRKVLAGIRVDGMESETYFFDDKYAKVYASLKAAMPGKEIQFNMSGDHAVVLANDAHERGKVYLFDVAKSKLEPVFSLKPEFDGKRLSEQKVISYTARDGLSIPAYLTLPEDRPAKNLPLVLYVHGGPHARDHKGFDPNAQMFASRGYAVLQPEYRMSIGFGWKHQRAGWLQWGLAMQDDLTDGINALAAQGIIDKQRVCIIGASYGGYATAFGLVKDPDLYKCGINWVGVTAVELLFTVTYSDTSGNPVMDDLGIRLHGDPKDPAQAAYFHNASAIEHADRIKAPLLMAYGSEDVRVPLVHGEKLRDKLRAKGNTVEWMVMPGEGHGWVKESNNIQWGQTMLDFVNRYIGKAQ